MPRAIWTGTITFGLLNIPVQLMSAEQHTDLHFHMLDARNNAPIRYGRINSETGEEVPWKEVIKAFQYEKGSYVVIEKEDFAKAAPETNEAVEIDRFVDPQEVGPQYFEKPYYLVPAKKAEKGYVLLRETLQRTKLAGLARVVIRTREYLALVLPFGSALVMELLRYPQELVATDEYDFPDQELDDYRITPKELEMAGNLIKSMVSKWQPSQYHDDFRDRLSKVIRQRVEAETGTVRAPEEAALPKEAATNVVDFMALLQNSLDANKGAPAPGSEKATRSAAPQKRKVSSAKKSARKAS